MIKRLNILLLLLFAVVFSASAQKMTVEKFVYLQNDLTARTKPRYDINEVQAALVKVATVLQEVEFDNILGEPEHITGEYLVYLPAGTKKLTIRHKNYLPLVITFADYGIDYLESKNTYGLTIEAGNNGPKPQLQGNFFTMNVNPNSARVSIDNREAKDVHEDGTFKEYLNNGSHTYRIEASGYRSQSGTVMMLGERVHLDVQLISAKASLSVKATTEDAKIFINEEYKGLGQWQGELDPGTYFIEARKDGFLSASTAVTLDKEQNKVINLPALQPKVGSLLVDYEPVDAEIYLDNTLLGTTPNAFPNLSVGQHNIKISKKGYQDFIGNVTIQANQQATINGKLAKASSNNSVSPKDNKNESQSETQPEVTPALTNTSEDNAVVSFTIKGVTFKMIKVEGGTFTMGASKEQGLDAFDDERPAHQVTLTDYYIGQTEVTQALWEAVMGNNPSYFKGKSLPVERISWTDCQKFIKKLNALTGKRFCLPTEAQWEFAARGGNMSKGYKFAGSNNHSTIGWCESENSNKTFPIKLKLPNELGLHDMSGNVWEWCHDFYDKYSGKDMTNPEGPSKGTDHVIRGGSCWNKNARYCRVSSRYHYPSDITQSQIGFRLCLRIGEAPAEISKQEDQSSSQEETDSNVDKPKTDNGIASYEVNGVTFKMIEVKGGTFTMGATQEQGSDAFDDERPTHQVTLTDYYIGQTEVTQALWEAVMGSNPSYFKEDNLPVENVSWEDCQAFINKLNTLTGKRFCLPTEAQWEYAARGGQKSKRFKYAGCNDNDFSKYAWSKGNCDHKTNLVMQKLPNELGLYDMSGNVWEWCQDWFTEYSNQAATNPTGPSDGSSRVVRGGCWYGNANFCRVSYRSLYSPDYSSDYLGFRLCLIP